MENNIALSIKNIFKEYSLKYGGDSNSTPFCALKGVTFDVNKGDVIGIIGNNGSGKTTLLKIISGITKPTKGEVHLFGTVTSILHVGSNFHPDLTGRENALLLLRINKKNKNVFDDYIAKIVEFSEVGEFFDQPVKYYSSGMFLRLAFSLAFHVASDILVLDEVLSVGDEGFRLKCQALLTDIAASGRTILFVSHDRTEILELCNRCVWIDKGEVKKIDTPAAILGEYFARHKDNFDGTKEIIEVDNLQKKVDYISLKWDEKTAPENKYLKIREVSLSSILESEKILNTEPIILNLQLEKKIKEEKIGVFFLIQDVFYQSVLVGHFLNNSEGKDISQETANFQGLIQIQCIIPPNLLIPGKYYLQLRFGMEKKDWNLNSEELLRFPENLSFTVHPDLNYVDLIGDLSKGSIRPIFEWKIDAQIK